MERGVFPRAPPNFYGVRGNVLHPGARGPSFQYVARYTGNISRPHYQSKRRKIALAKDEQTFLKDFEAKIVAKRRHAHKLTIVETLTKLGKVYKLLETCKDSLDDVDLARKLEESSQTITTVCTEQNMRQLKKLVSRNGRGMKETAHNRERRNAKISALALEIDHWRATMLAEEKKKKQDEELQSEAGNTLQQVLQKQKQTKRLLDTVKLLVELRDIRKQQAARRHGTFVEPEVDHRFAKNVGKMKSMIKDKLETFYAEEKTIKVLMEANEADIWGVEKKLRQLEQLPNNVIDYSSVYLEIQYNPRTLVKIRKEWDDYLATPGTVHSSRIPTTDLTPPSNPSPVWAVYFRAPTDTQS